MNKFYENCYQNHKNILQGFSLPEQPIGSVRVSPQDGGS